MIEDIETFRTLIPTVTGSSLDKYRQPLADARAWLASRITGEELLTEIEHQEHTAPLFLRARQVIACKAYLLAIPLMDVIETDNGFAVVNSETLAPASRDRVTALTGAVAQNLNMALEQLVECLEETPEYRHKWKNTPAGSASAVSYFPSLRRFRLYSTFSGGYIDYLQEQPALRRIIRQIIEPRISLELSRQIIDQVQTDSLSPSNERIIEDLRVALAGYHEGDPQTGESALCRVREVLEERPDDFPAFRDSDLYRRIIEAAARKKESGSIYVAV